MATPTLAQIQQGVQNVATGIAGLAKSQGNTNIAKQATTIASGGVPNQPGNLNSTYSYPNGQVTPPATYNPAPNFVGTTSNFNPNAPITADALANNQPLIQLPDSQNINTGGILAGINASAGLNNVNLSPDVKAQLAVLDNINNSIAKPAAPPSQSDIYNTDYNNSGVRESQQAVNNYQAQLSNITAKAQADKLTTTGQGRGIPEVIIGGQQAQIDKEAAIQALPIAAQLSAAQGNLALAQQHLDTLFKIHSEDARNQYDYQLKLYDTARSYADKQQQVILNGMAAESAQRNKFTQDNLNFARDLAKTAIENGQSKLSAQIIDLVNSGSLSDKTGTAALSALQAQIKPKADLMSVGRDSVVIDKNTGKIVYQGQSSATTDSLPAASPVAKLSDGTYDSSSQEALLAQMSPTEAALVKAVGTYTMDLSKVTSLRSDQRQRLAEKVALVYPDFQMQNYGTIAAYKKNLANTTQGSTGGAINSANKVINHLTSYISNVGKLGNGSIGGPLGTYLNAGNNALISVFSPSRQAALSEANTDATGVKDELAKFFKGSGVADVSTINDWAKTVNVNASPASQRGAVQGAIELLQGQLVPMIDQYKQTLGTEPPPGLFLKTDTISKLATLKNQGFKIDIPGVYYTDKKAWEHYGGGTESDLTNAYNTLKAAGVATTPENILQAAQLQ